MDPLSKVLSLLKLDDYVAGSFVVDRNVGFDFPKHVGMKCYTVVSGSCWMLVDGTAHAVLVEAGDCVLLPRGLPFCLAVDLALPRVNFPCESAGRKRLGDEFPLDGAQGCSIVGGHFPLAGSQSVMLLGSLPPIVHVRKESDRMTMRWSLERMRDEVRDPQPGGSLVAQHLVYMMLVQVLRLHLQEEAAEGAGELFALADPQMRIAIQCMHDHPGHSWTLQELADRLCMSRAVFAQRFKTKVGMTPISYLTRWRMLLASERLKSSDDSISAVCSSMGYKAESAFGRAFRRVWGCSPREHRRRPEA